MNRYWDFSLPAILIVTAAAPTLGQTAIQAAAPIDSGNQSAAPVPDLSGFWGHFSLPSFEPPLAGPGPILNKSRVRQVFGNNGRPLPPGTSPLASSLFQFVGDYSNPILKPEAAEAVKKHGEIELNGMPAPVPSNQCWPGGVPYVFINVGMQMIQQQDRITILYSYYNEVRRVRMNQRHPAHVTPSWYGDSVGHYEGETLVIDTVGIKVGPFAMIDWFGTPHTEALHVVERYRLLDYEATMEAEERGERENFRLPGSDAGFARNPEYKGKGLQLALTVEDEGVFTTPWSATMTYRRPLGEWGEVVCAENPQLYPGKYAAIPTADKPDF
jgi:hypothetical protein